MRVRVLGQGYVGLPLAMLAVEAGHHVVGFDVDAGRVRALSGGHSHIEDVSTARLRAAQASGRYRASCDPCALAGFDVAVISVPTPLVDGCPDLSFVESAAVTLGPHVRTGSTVVLESTTYPGTTEEVVRPLLESRSGLRAGDQFHLGYSPERIDPGNPSWPLQRIPKIVAGIDPASEHAVTRFVESLGIAVVSVAGTREAELAKLLENTFRHVNIALVNELTMVAHELGIDVWEAIRAAGTKPFGFMPFTPGPGVGGHCLPIDPSYLSWRVEEVLGHRFRFISLANDVNERMPEYVVHRVAAGLQRRGRSLSASDVVLLGLTYKAGTADTRESPSYAVADHLLRLGAHVSVADPRAPLERTPAGASRVAGDLDDLRSADAVVLLTDHHEFDLAALSTLPGFVLDCRGVTAAAAVERL